MKIGISWAPIGAKNSFSLNTLNPTMFDAAEGQMAVFSSLEKEDLQIEEYPSAQGAKNNLVKILILNWIKFFTCFNRWVFDQCWSISGYFQLKS